MKFRFLLIDETGEVSGTDDEVIARAAASAGVGCVVIDVAQNKCLQDDGNPEDAEILEADRDNWIDEDPADDESEDK